MRALPLLALLVACNDTNLAVYNTPPAVTIIAPESDTVFSPGDLVQFHGVVQDSQDEGDQILVSWISDIDGVVGGEAPDGSGDTFFSTANLSPGIHAITFKAVDSNGESDAETVSIVVGGAPGQSPVVTIINPDEGESLYHDGPIAFLANVLDADQPAETLGLSVLSDEDGTVWTGYADQDGDVEIELYGLTPGPQTLTLRATDDGGNIGQASVDIDAFDDGRPRVTIDNPLPGDTVFNDINVPLEGTVSDDLTEVEQLRVVWESDVDGLLFDGAPDSTGFTATSFPLTSGIHTITLTATDAEDKVGTRSVIVEAINPLDIDDDGDGYTENEGDCDDLDPNFNPGEIELCDEFDNNCDGQINEPWKDAYEDDGNETLTNPYDLGELDDDTSGETKNININLHHPGDEDWFRWDADDEIWDNVNMQVTVNGLLVDSAYVVELYRREGSSWVLESSQGGTGTLRVQFNSDTFDTGDDDYLLSVRATEWTDTNCDASHLVTIRDQ
ncbi:MAG: putative metal-binding motif-containing protein [Myxococcota bacterium]